MPLSKNIRLAYPHRDKVGRVYMPRNRETGQIRGFAFVEIANVSAPHFLAVESANGLFRLIV